jgi:hypothetical protein
VGFGVDEPRSAPWCEGGVCGGDDVCRGLGVEQAADSRHPVELWSEAQIAALSHRGLAIADAIEVEFGAGVAGVGGELLEGQRGREFEEPGGGGVEVGGGDILGGGAKTCADCVGGVEREGSGGDGGRDIHEPWGWRRDIGWRGGKELADPDERLSLAERRARERLHELFGRACAQPLGESGVAELAPGAVRDGVREFGGAGVDTPADLGEGALLVDQFGVGEAVGGHGHEGGDGRGEGCDVERFVEIGHAFILPTFERMY